VVLTLVAIGTTMVGDAAAQSVPRITIEMEDGPSSGEDGGRLATGLKIALLLTGLSLVPSLLVMMTAFTRIVVVFSFLRQAMSTPSMPPNQVLLSLALFLTVFIMMPVWGQVNDRALQPLMRGEITEQEAIRIGTEPVREFMLGQTREKDLMLFARASGAERPDGPEDLSMSVILPSFMLSELKTAFQIGFVLYIPFLVVDLVVASVLMSMGMMMLPPAMISLPFKILLFVLVDGWHLIVRSLIKSFA
jgi:flagellar biosynthetic protein FliP